MNIASSTLSQIGHFLKGDMLFFVVGFILFLVFALYAGKGRVISVILAYYPASILFNTLPFINKLLVLQGNMLVLNKIAIFLIFLVPLSIIINSYIFSESMHSGAQHLLRTAGLALILLVLTVAFSYSVVNYDAFHNFTSSTDVLFSPASKVFYWNFGIFALLAFL
jgi:hypothetical protein